MQGVIHENYYVYPYATMLQTVSPLLKEIYCESHRYEPFAVHGNQKRYGRYIFPNILYIEKDLRQGLLEDITEHIATRPEFLEAILHRFRESGRKMLRRLVQANRGDHSRENIHQLIDETARFLSCGIFKEVFEYKEALAFLQRFMPAEKLFDKVLTLYQPLCLAHYLKYQLKLFYFAGQYAREGDEKWISRCIDKSAYLTRFFVEDTPYDDPDVMEREIIEAIQRYGGNGEGVRKQRQAMLQGHRDVVRESLMAERDILQVMDEYGSYQLRSKMAVKNALKFIQFIATTEELKHIFTVQTAKVVKGLFKKHELPVETTTTANLLEKLR